MLRNEGTKNHWFGIDLPGVKNPSNGARVIVSDAKDKKQIFDVSNSGSYLSANDSRILVGLGEVASVKSIEVRRSNGKTQIIETPEIDRYILINLY